MLDNTDFSALEEVLFVIFDAESEALVCGEGGLLISLPTCCQVPLAAILFNFS
jgi:hypothetical protein